MLLFYGVVSLHAVVQWWHGDWCGINGDGPAAYSDYDGSGDQDSYPLADTAGLPLSVTGLLLSSAAVAALTLAASGRLDERWRNRPARVTAVALPTGAVLFVIGFQLGWDLYLAGCG
jgi:hypothetical protein